MNLLPKQGAALPAPIPDPRQLSPQATRIWPCEMLGRLMSRIWVFQTWFELLFFLWTTQTLPEASFLEKSEHCRIYGLREELEFSSLSLGSCSGAPVWPCPYPRRGRRGTRDCPRHRGMWLGGVTPPAALCPWEAVLLWPPLRAG